MHKHDAIHCWNRFSAALIVSAQFACYSSQRVAGHNVNAVCADSQSAMAPCPARAYDVLTRADVLAAALPEDATAYDALYRLRPEFLQEHRASGTGERVRLPGIRINDAPTTDLQVLRTIPARSLVDVRFVRSLDARYRFGAGYPAGVILVQTERLE